ncbi:protamine-like [Bicyclus anynana]|uniref:Protamine-like n=1 Tax=Bicyclus anynana TaxID=110368 RepID=A0ABM3M094_BICAN|nr:protamine-like [Bicyclus anynana]
MESGEGEEVLKGRKLNSEELADLIRKRSQTDAIRVAKLNSYAILQQKRQRAANARRHAEQKKRSPVRKNDNEQKDKLAQPNQRGADGRMNSEPVDRCRMRRRRRCSRRRRRRSRRRCCCRRRRRRSRSRCRRRRRFRRRRRLRRRRSCRRRRRH